MVEVGADDTLIEEHLDLHEIENHMHDEKELHQPEIDHIEDQMLIDDLPRSLDLIHLVGHRIQINQELLVQSLEEGTILDLVEVDSEINLELPFLIGNQPDNYSYFIYKKNTYGSLLQYVFFLILIIFLEN